MIDWDMILEGEHKKALALLYYRTGTIEKLAYYLGVSETPLKAKLRKENVVINPPGRRKKVIPLGQGK